MKPFKESRLKICFSGSMKNWRYGRVQPSEVRKIRWHAANLFQNIVCRLCGTLFGMPGNYRITKCPGYEF